MVSTNQTCPYCHFNFIPSGSAFCPNCGKRLKEERLSPTIFKQIGIYLISFFLPPLGIWPGIKYLRQSDPRLKKIGIIALVLTTISLVLTFYLAKFLTNYLNQLVQYQVGNLEFGY